MLDPSGFTLPYDRALCRGLVAAGAEVVLYTRPARPGEAPGDPFDAVHFHHAGESRLGRRLPDRLRLAVKGLEYGVDAARLVAALAADPPDVVHLQWMPVPLLDRAFVAALKSVAPVVATVHDTTPFRGSPSSRLQEVGWDAALKSVDRLIVHTEGGRDVLEQRGFDPARIVRIDHGRLDPGPIERTPRGIELRLLLFGALKPYKGIDVAVAAVRALHADGVPVRLRVVGAPRMEGPSPGAPDGAVEWDLRRVPDAEVPDVLGWADVHVFPYHHVDASGALLTVLGRGAPVLASAVGGPRELLTDGVDAALVPPGDVSALAAAIELMFLDAHRERLAVGGAATAEALPSWEEIARATLNAYPIGVIR